MRGTSCTCMIFLSLSLSLSLPLPSSLLPSLRCGNVNWARRNECNICNAPKFGTVEPRTGMHLHTSYRVLFIWFCVKYLGLSQRSLNQWMCMCMCTCTYTVFPRNLTAPQNPTILAMSLQFHPVHPNKPRPQNCNRWPRGLASLSLELDVNINDGYDRAYIHT